MNILYFHQHFSTPKGSTGIRAYAMAQGLIRNGHNVTIVCGSSKVGNTGLTNAFENGVRKGVVDNINIIEYDLPYSNNLSFFKRALVFFKFAFYSIKLVFVEKYDIVFATTTPLTTSLPGIVARWLRGKEFIFEVRDLWPELPRAMGVIKNPFVLMMMYVLEWSAYHSANRLIGLSPGIVEGIRRKGIEYKKIISIPNGCDLDIFAYHDIEGWRPHGVSSQDFMAIFTGTHGLANGLDVLIDVAIELKNRKKSNIKLVLIGSGMKKASLKQKVNDLSLSSYIIFHNPVDKRKLAGLMRDADMGLQILANVPEFYYGTSPNKFFDYIAAGLPVLINYPGWLAELIEQKHCGFVVPPESPKVFADMLEYAAAHRDELVVMGRNAHDLAITQFNRQELSQKFVEWVTQE